MGTVWEKLFKNNAEPANDSRALVIRHEPGEDAPSPAPPVLANMAALAPSDPGRNGDTTPRHVTHH